jgi:hypothetical protein
MKKLLLLTLIGASALCADAAVGTHQSVLNQPIKKTAAVNETVISSKLIKPDLRLDVVVDAYGRRFKKLVSPRFENSKIKQPAKVRHAATTGLSESFEGWDFVDSSWQPEGWSTLSKGEVEQLPWAVTAADGYFTPSCDGDVIEYVEYPYDVEDTIDEFLYTPQVTIGEANALTFYLYSDLIYLFSMENLNDSYEYEGGKQLTQTLKVLISEDNGANWKEIYDFASLYADYDFWDLMYESSSYTGEYHKIIIPLDEYAGKTVQFAFEDICGDGSSLMLDNVNVGIPAYDVSYVNPTSVQYMGLSADLSYFEHSIGICPVYEPLTWTNTSDEVDGAEFTWYYANPDGQIVTTNTKDLTVTYHPNYADEQTKMNNWYDAPVLTGRAAGTSDGKFSKLDYFQYGGKGQVDEGSYGVTQYGMAPFNYLTENITLTIDQSSGVVPFGYSEATDEYWTAYSFPDEEDRTDGNYAYLDGVINVFAPTKAPLVIDGAWMLVYASNVKSNAEFKLEIIPLTEEGALGDPIGTAVVKGSDYNNVYSYYGVLNFKFDEPVVVSSDICAQYAVRVTGFHNSADLIAPIQSAAGNSDGMYIGWIQKVVSWDGVERQGLSAVVKYTGTAQSFAIMLDGTYPWLQGDDVVDMSHGSAELKLDSYYDGSEFNVTAPDWLNVSVSGQYDECVANFAVTGETESENAEVVLEVPGFKKTVKLENIAGVASIVNNNGAQVKEYISLTGARLGANKPENAGVYIVRYTNGKYEKLIVK